MSKKKNKARAIVPLGERVLVEREPLSDTSEGGIIMATEQTDSLIRWGTIIELAPNMYESGFDVGDRVAFNKYAGIVIAGEDLVILEEKELLAVEN